MPKKPQSYESATEPAVQCSFAMCRTPALIHRRTDTGWANVCRAHDSDLADREARDWLKAEGIERQPGEDMRDWIARMLEHVRNKSQPLRRAIDTPTAVELLQMITAITPDSRPIEYSTWESAPAHESELES